MQNTVVYCSWLNNLVWTKLAWNKIIIILIGIIKLEFVWNEKHSFHVQLWLRFAFFIFRHAYTAFSPFRSFFQPSCMQVVKFHCVLANLKDANLVNEKNVLSLPQQIHLRIAQALQTRPFKRDATVVSWTMQKRVVLKEKGSNPYRLSSRKRNDI